MTTKTKNKFIQSFKIWIAIYPSITLINVKFVEQTLRIVRISFVSK